MWSRATNLSLVVTFALGVLITIPVTVAAIAAAYQDTVGSSPSLQPVLF